MSQYSEFYVIWKIFLNFELFLRTLKLPKSFVYLVFDRLKNSSLVFATSLRQIVVCVAVTFIQLFVV